MQEPRKVSRPARANTPLVRRVLDRLELARVAWAPRFLHLHEGKEVLSWLPGLPLESWTSELELLDDLARIVRHLHDLTAEMADNAECFVHDDLQPRNVVVEGDFIGLIDWEQLRPGLRVEDVAQLCWAFAGPTADDTPDAVALRWRRILDAYGLVDRGEVVHISIAKIERCMEDIVREADRGSTRHQVLEDRGDHHNMRTTLEWLSRHQVGLGAAIVRRGEAHST